MAMRATGALAGGCRQARRLCRNPDDRRRGRMTSETSDLFISRLIKAAPNKVWTAWSRPEHLARWWIPQPIECQVVKLDLRPGGGFETRMREGSEDFQPHVEACFVDVVPEQRLVWTTVLAEGWRP